VWFFFVLVYDLVLLGVLVGTGGAGGNAFPFLLLLNPADVFRILNVFSSEQARTFYGLATVFPQTLSDPWFLGSIMVFWIAAPLGLAAWRFK
ncbi:MAG: ABC transporter permease subunit, partial [Sulfuriferula sp.]